MHDTQQTTPREFLHTITSKARTLIKKEPNLSYLSINLLLRNNSDDVDLKVLFLDGEGDSFTSQKNFPLLDVGLEAGSEAGTEQGDSLNKKIALLQGAFLANDLLARVNSALDRFLDLPKKE